MAIALSILSSFLVGVILLVAPWTPWWETNYLLLPHPLVRSVLLSTFTRGVVSGLGVVNILLAVHEGQQSLRGRP